MLYPKTIALTPRTGAKGQVVLPGSKSISNRMLLLAALAEGTTRLHNLLDSDDTRVMIDSLRKLGVVMSESHIDGQPFEVRGAAGQFANTGALDAPIKLIIGNSGLTIRTLVPALVASLSSTGGCVEISGVPRMHERPIGDLVDGLRAIGAKIDYLSEQGFPPLRITGVALAPNCSINACCRLRLTGTSSPLESVSMQRVSRRRSVLTCLLETHHVRWTSCPSSRCSAISFSAPRIRASPRVV